MKRQALPVAVAVLIRPSGCWAGLEWGLATGDRKAPRRRDSRRYDVVRGEKTRRLKHYFRAYFRLRNSSQKPESGCRRRNNSRTDFISLIFLSFWSVIPYCLSGATLSSGRGSGQRKIGRGGIFPPPGFKELHLGLQKLSTGAPQRAGGPGGRFRSGCPIPLKVVC